MIEVVAPGPLATVQDLGRRGYAQLGVGRSGAADRPALARANALVGNPADAAGVEITLGGFRARFTESATIALTGAACAGELGDGPLPMDRRVAVPPGTVLRLRTPVSGLRTYLAVAGGIAVAPVLGSRSTDLLSGLGPPPLTRGAMLPVGPDPGSEPGSGALSAGVLRACFRSHPFGAAGPRRRPAAPDRPLGLAATRPELPKHALSELVVFPGPREDWFVAGALATLCSAPYVVTAASNRIGLRLAGPVLERRVRAELPPEGMVEGALQVPPDGQPVLFLADHPVTGGYPVLGVVDAAGVAAAAQARPGSRLRFALAGR